MYSEFRVEFKFIHKSHIKARYCNVYTNPVAGFHTYLGVPRIEFIKIIK